MNLNNDQHVKTIPWCNGGIYILEAINNHLTGLKALSNGREFIPNMIRLAVTGEVMNSRGKCMTATFLSQNDF